MNSIFKRTSIRKFTQEAVKQEDIDLLLKAAMAAPSAGNQCPWQFYVVTDRELIEQLSTVHQYAGCAKNAPLVIVPAYKNEGLVFPEYAQIDLSIACENMWLEATELNLGCVWLGIAPLEDRMQKVNEILNIENAQAFSLMVIGHPDHEYQPTDHYDKSRIHYLK